MSPDGAPEPAAVAEAVARVRGRIADAGGGDDVALVAVTKGFDVAAVRAAAAAGLDVCAESYAQELVAKREALARLDAPEPTWHFVGRLQRNKVRSLTGAIALWQSVDREALGREIARRAPGAAVLVQCEISGESTKAGCPVDEVPDLVASLGRLGLDVRGLMGIGPAGPPEAARPGFRRLVGLADALELPVRSIGMSDDLEVAVEEGSTMVRIGTALFGPRTT